MLTLAVGLDRPEVGLVTLGKRFRRFRRLLRPDLHPHDPVTLGGEFGCLQPFTTIRPVIARGKVAPA